MPKITANFSSIDMATLAIKSVTSRVKSVESVKISYKTHSNYPHTEISSSMFLPMPIQNGVYTNETIAYPVNLNAIRENNEKIEHRRTRSVQIELKTTSNEIQAVKTNLRNYGGLNVKVFNS